MAREVVILSAVRTPIGRFGGKLKDFKPHELGAIAIKAAIEKAGIDPKDLGIVYMGHVIRAAHGQNTARQAAMKAGIPPEVDNVTVDLVCSSGMMAIINAAQGIMVGDYDLAVAGGMESMSYSYLAIDPSVRWGIRFLLGREMKLIDCMYHDGLTDPIANRVMGDETEDVIESWGITREELDNVAYMSHMRAAEATDKGYFKNEIVPIELPGGEVFDYDEGIRRDTSLDKLAKLKPAFRPNGKLTAGNSSQISDGAAALVLASAEKAKELGAKPIAKIIGYSWAGIESQRFNEGPLPATEKLLKRMGVDVNYFDLFEVNEAFASNNVLFNRKFGVPYDRINIFGGAIALGHPVGCSGARIVVTLINVLKHKGMKRGIATLCHGTGGGTALAVEVM
ncbi:MAG: acetyl-CoA C-acyltransferase [Thermoprotei archaeon]|nr:MAG: acetyl-CoA C-acyltransferase [Thermoprotei archaeon]